MSDVEEPPSKLTKFQMESQYLEGEAMEEGQEEWLSEGILTDDDYNPSAEQDISGNTSQEETMASTNDNSVDQGDTTNSQGYNQDEQENSQLMQDTMMHSEENIEETLNNFENSQNNNQMDLPDDLDAYLIRKTNVTKPGAGGAPPKEDKDSDIDDSANQSEDDGNDTDDLLRVLGDGGEGITKKEDASSDDDDDEYIFEGAQVKTLQVATSALMRKYPATKAVPEDDDITDASGDEAETMKKMFSVQPSEPAQSTTPLAKSTTPLAKSTTPSARSTTPLTKSTTPTTKSTSRAPVKTAIKEAKQPRAESTRVVTHRQGQPKFSHSTPLKTYTNTHTKTASTTGNKSLLKSVTPEHKIFEGRETRSMAAVVEKKLQSPEVQKLPERTETQPQAREPQRMMPAPEQMDEEIPTDADSESDEESLYDELPTTDSETNEGWFSLDIRAERAGDYIPLLGPKAHRVLTEEKHRVTQRVASLKESLAALADSGRSQAAQLRQATVALAELDAMLKTA